MHAKKRSRKGRALIILLIVLLVLAAGVCALYFWQKNNIEAVLQFNRYSKEEIEQQLQQSDQDVQDILDAALEAAREVDKQNGGSPSLTAPEKESAPEATPTPEPTPESDTQATPEQEAPVVTAPTPEYVPAPQPTAEPEATPEPAPELDMGEYEARLMNLVDRVYALRDEYVGALEALQGEAVAAYKAMPEESRKQELSGFISTYLAKGSALERNCDAKMDALVAELRALQTEYGQSMDLVEAVKYTYANEKSLKKAWYMSELEARGFI